MKDDQEVEARKEEEEVAAPEVVVPGAIAADAPVAESPLMADDVVEDSGLPSLTLAERLAQDHVAALARIAVAYSPPERAVQLENIADVGVLAVDGHHVEIQAVVYDSETCVSLLVPVEFPEACEGDEMEECVLENVRMLDSQAEQRIEEMKRTAEQEEELTEVWNELLDPNEMLSFPSWWAAPRFMAWDCDQLRDILNKSDFQTELQNLATKSMAFLVEGGANYTVEQAAVVAICPSGVFLRAKAKPTTDAEAKSQIVDLQVPFEAPAPDADALRDIIFNAVMASAPA